MQDYNIFLISKKEKKKKQSCQFTNSTRHRTCRNRVTDVFQVSQP